MKKLSLFAALLLCLTLLGGCFFSWESDLLPAAEYSDWNLILVDAEHSVPSDWEVTLVDLRGGEQVDRRIIDPLQEMFDACKEILAAMGSSVTRCGDVGAGNTTKLANQIIVRQTPRLPDFPQ